MNNYTAPWSTSLIVMSSLVTAICLGVSISLLRVGHLWEALFPLAIVCGGALFTVRGYTVTPEAILIHRLLWTTRFPLAALHSAQVVPQAMRRSIRTFGNGGLFSFTGWFYSKALGAYRAFVTDPHRAVVLQFARRNIVVSPSAPEEFVRDIRTTIHAV